MGTLYHINIKIVIDWNTTFQSIFFLKLYMHNNFWNIQFSHLIKWVIFTYKTWGEYEIVMFYKQFIVRISYFRFNDCEAFHKSIINLILLKISSFVQDLCTFFEFFLLRAQLLTNKWRIFNVPATILKAILPSNSKKIRSSKNHFSR